MKEILMINVGQAGIKIGDKTWQILTKQHKINKKGQQISDDTVYDNHTIFNETPQRRFVPRNIFVDTDVDSIDQIKRGQRRDIYKSSNLISGKQDTSNNYFRGNMTIGRQIINQTLDQIRKIIEGCNHLEGIIINHAISGGTGSGFANLLLERLEHQSGMKKKTVISNLICPSPNISDTIVEPYNSILSLGELAKNKSDKIVNCFDNQKMYKRCEQNGIENPGYNQVNELIARSISILTHHYRLQPTVHNLDQIRNNMVPYKKICFLSPKIHYETLAQHQNSRNFIKTMWNKKSCLSSYAQYTDKKIEISMSTFLRGCVPKLEVCQQFQYYKRNANWIDWCKTGFKLFSNEIEGSSSQNFIQGLTLTNSNSIEGLLHRLHTKFDKLYDKRAFVHWYVGQGMQDREFRYGRQETAQLEKDYQEVAVLEDRDDNDIDFQ